MAPRRLGAIGAGAVLVLALAGCARSPAGEGRAGAHGSAALGGEAGAKAAAAFAEAGAAIAGAAAEAVPLPGRWRALDGLPGSCLARVAVDAAASIAPLPWRPCTSGRPGCTAFVADWGAPGDGFRFRPGVFEPAFEDDAGVHVSYLRSDGAARPYLLHVVQRLHGAAEAAFYAPRGGCAVAASASRHGLAVRAIMPAGAAPPHYLGAPSLAAPATATMIAASLDPATPLSQNATRGAGLITIEAMGLGGSVRGAGFALAGAGFIADRGAAVLERPLPVAGGFVALADGATPAIVRVDLDGQRRTRIQPAAGSRIGTFALDRARGDALVWPEAGADGAVSLWTAALDDGPARRVARLPALGAVVANAGAALVVLSPERARIVRLADGRAWDLAREPDAAWVYPLWVNDDAAWFVVSDLLPGQPGFPAQAGVVRIARAGLE